MRRYLFAIILQFFGSTLLRAQDMFDQSLESLEELNNLTYDYIASFLEHPDNHENTLRVFHKLQTVGEFYKEQYDRRFELLSKYDNYKTRQYIAQIEKAKLLVDGIDEFVGNIAGYIRAGVESSTFDYLLKPLFEQLGWECKILPVQCQDIVFFEYSKGEFKMMLAYNTRPAPDNMQFINVTGKYNDNEVSCYTYFKEFHETTIFAGYVVRGGKYRLIQYKDNQKKDYHNLTKATSKRIN